ncbi:type II toxin-antitoxin system VapC family toxin [Corticibacterium sp. UT-5YL-CI-8]|nr:type II toxin-antitoxin system VapC family toxin [Tianweitania sp. UT-5YL-CI-8]
MPRAIDTNILVRILADDGSDQVARARALLAEGDLFVTTTVLLETEWVLRGRYQYNRRQITDLFKGLIRIKELSFAEEASVRSALDSHAKGLDFADALHLALSAGCNEFLTFDREFEKHPLQEKLQPPVRMS